MENPFNAAQRQIVKTSETRIIVFWSKNPAPISPFLSEILDLGKKFYFHFTLNNYEDTGIEPHVPGLRERVKTFLRLARDYEVIWRYDPVILGAGLDVKTHLAKVENIMRIIGHATRKLVFSFLDLYGKTARNLYRFNSDLRPPTVEEIREFSLGLLEMRDKHAPTLELATCAEAGIDFNSLGIRKNSCIDPVLINKICQENIYSPLEGGRRQLLPTALIDSAERAYPKDRGQRKECGCAPARDIGSYRRHPCGHNCVYCYAGHACRKQSCFQIAKFPQNFSLPFFI